jgi:hypothetical protein
VRFRSWEGARGEDARKSKREKRGGKRGGKEEEKEGERLNV